MKIRKTLKEKKKEVEEEKADKKNTRQDRRT